MSGRLPWKIELDDLVADCSHGTYRVTRDGDWYGTLEQNGVSETYAIGESLVVVLLDLEAEARRRGHA